MKTKGKTSKVQKSEGKHPKKLNCFMFRGKRVKTWRTPQEYADVMAISDSFKEPEKKEFRMSGETVEIQNMRTSLHLFPSFARKEMDECGNAFLSNCTYATHKCGCEIIGNGTLHNSLEIKFCNKHK